MQIFLPYSNQQNSEIIKQQYSALKKQLADHFGGITVYSRAPVTSIWKPGPSKAQTDNMVSYEVLVQELELSYWNTLKSRLQSNSDKKNS